MEHSPESEVQLGPGAIIARSELVFKATPGGGPGGQHVNRSATRVELWWDITASRLPPAVRARLLTRLARRLDSAGRLRVVAGSRRSQLQNREEALARLVELVTAALHIPKARKRSRPTQASVERRLSEKKRRGQRKADRRRADDRE